MQGDSGIHNDFINPRRLVRPGNGGRCSARSIDDTGPGRDRVQWLVPGAATSDSAVRSTPILRTSMARLPRQCRSLTIWKCFRFRRPNGSERGATVCGTAGRRRTSVESAESSPRRPGSRGLWTWLERESLACGCLLTPLQLVGQILLFRSESPHRLHARSWSATRRSWGQSCALNPNRTHVVPGH